MRRGIRNYISVRVKDMDLTTCSNLKFYVEQDGTTFDYSGTINYDDTEVMRVEIPKEEAVMLSKGLAQVQVALTDAGGVPRSHDPIRINIGDFLEETGYGS